MMNIHDTVIFLTGAVSPASGYEKKNPAERIKYEGSVWLQQHLRLV